MVQSKIQLIWKISFLIHNLNLDLITSVLALPPKTYSFVHSLLAIFQQSPVGSRNICLAIQFTHEGSLLHKSEPVTLLLPLIGSFNNTFIFGKHVESTKALLVCADSLV